MALSKPTLEVLFCERDASRIRELRRCLGMRSQPEEGEFVILFFKKPLAGRTKASSRKRPSRKRKAAR
jgi:hypothetical protein